MCGIFGVIVKKNTGYNSRFLESAIKNIAEVSEERGKDSSGLTIRAGKNRVISVIKGPLQVSQLLRDKNVKEKIAESIDDYTKGENLVLIGHSRLVTNGSQLFHYNNQPVIKDGISAIHNGIIVNVDSLWAETPGIKREYDIDTEVLLALIRNNLNHTNDTAQAISSAMSVVYGTVASAFLFDDRDELALVTNNGSLYIATDYNTILLFASERHMLEKLDGIVNLGRNIKNLVIEQVIAKNGLVLNLADFLFEKFTFDQPCSITRYEEIARQSDKYAWNLMTIEGDSNQRSALVDLDLIRTDLRAGKEEKLLQYNVEAIKSLKRCTRCLLPETFPFIEFDHNGVCNICNNYTPKNQPTKKESLLEFVEPYRKPGGEPECLIPFSGGRDSSYMLHYIVNELHLKPVTFTYDWGMVTDLARRNVARMCGKLGVENIIVSADIRTKRENIRKNVSAWLKNPALGMVPLFMTGDKWFFYYINKLLKETKTEISFSGSNSLENTDFKVGFSGINIDFKKKAIDSMRLTNKLKLLSYIGKNVMLNPAYINSSVYDSLFSFYARYFLSRKNLIFFFGYVNWNEKLIERTLIDGYDWELSADTTTSWRIGDGTVGFYNYIYYTVAGFSEIETFRSNQIREGLITREKALELIYDENKPRYESIKWYLETIGLDFEDTITKINGIKKLYEL